MVAPVPFAAKLDVILRPSTAVSWMGVPPTTVALTPVAPLFAWIAAAVLATSAASVVWPTVVRPMAMPLMVRVAAPAGVTAVVKVPVTVLALAVAVTPLILAVLIIADMALASEATVPVLPEAA